MNPEQPKVGIVSLGEAGNLGDDLILIAAVDAIYDRWPNASVSFLSFGQELDWGEIARSRGYRSVPQRVRDTPELPLVRENRRKFDDRDVIVFGGGGLLQTSHSPDRPYEWLSYLPTGGRHARVVAVGLGLGPLTEHWVNRLKKLGSPFDLAWVRDPESLELAKSRLRWAAKECRDFIDDDFLSTIRPVDKMQFARRNTLGVALRSWPGLAVEQVAATVERVAIEHGCDRADFFVLEANRGRGVDVDFTTQVARAVSIPAEVIAYDGRRLSEFLDRMLTVKASISMKLHSSAVWASASIPLLPIFYAPKISAFFGVPYRGLEIASRIMAPAPAVVDVPRAASALAEGVEVALFEAARGRRFSAPDRVRFQLRRVLRALLRRATIRRGGRR